MISDAPTSAEPLLRLRAITKSYGSINALSDASFDLHAGEALALLGENGAGKSTIVKVLAGLVRPDAGEVLLDGRPVKFRGSADSQSQGIAVVTQEVSLIPTMSVAQNLTIGQVGSRVIWRPRALRRQARTLLDAMGLEAVDPDALVGSLGVAERQLVEIARVAARGARIIILDEPTAALSDFEIERVLALVRRLTSEGRAVIYVTHRLDEVFKVCGRVQVMRGGRALPSALTADLDPHRVIEMMLGRELADMFPPRPPRGASPVTLTVDGLLAPGLTAPVSFTAREGEIVGLTGQIGSGAAAAVRALAGITRQVGGRVTLADGELDLGSRRRGIEQGVAYCSADRKADGIFASLSVRQNLSSPWMRKVATGNWVNRDAESERVRQAAEDFTIDLSRLDSDAATLSGGNQQKVALGKWLGIDPVVFLADEPTRGVDVGARAEIYRHLRGLADRGVTILIASTDSAEIFGLCDVIATFERGAMAEIRSHDNWTEAELLHSVMHMAKPDAVNAGAGS